MVHVPGIPCIYYASEWGEEGKKENGDEGLRLSYKTPVQNELTNVISKLAEIRLNSNALSYGTFRNVVVTNKQLYHYRMNEGSLSHAKWSPNKMGTGHIVWGLLEKDTKEKYPQFTDIASTSFVVSDMWQLYYAALSNYPKDEYIDMYQKHVKNNLDLIRKTDTITRNKKVFAEIIARNYKLGSLLAKLSRY